MPNRATQRLPRAVSAWLALGYVLVLTGGLLAPFEFSAKSNGATWSEGSTGIEFRHPGVLRASAPAQRLYDALLKGTGFSLEVLLKTGDEWRQETARIISYSGGYGPRRNFTLGHRGKDLFFVIRTGENEDEHASVTFRPAVLSPDEFLHVLITYDFSELRAYVNGKLISSSLSSGQFSAWDDGYAFLIGNESTLDRPWFGQIALVSIYDRTISEAESRDKYATIDEPSGRIHRDSSLVALYLFSEGTGRVLHDHSGKSPTLDLVIPTLPSPQIYEDFVSPSALSPRANDILVNFVAFIPLGFLLHGAIAGTRSASVTIGVVIILGLLYSLSMESLQHFLPGRFPSVIDTANNVAGLAVGIATQFFLREHSMRKGAA